MIDPRYDNVEVYHSNEYGLILKGILAGHELLTEKLLPGIPAHHYRAIRRSAAAALSGNASSSSSSS